MAEGFVENAVAGIEVEVERALVARAQGGDSAAVEALVRDSQRWVFNLVLRMVPDFEEAEDLCQEILLKSVRKLPTFRAESRYRTWLYRLAMNHVLGAKEAKCETAHRLSLTEGDPRDWSPGEELADKRIPPHDFALLVEEIRIKCLLGMLLCLTRQQRVVFILGSVFGLGGKTASGILGMSGTAYRQILSRSRRRLHNFLADRCSLVDPARPCRCERCVLPGVRNGYIDPLHLIFRAEGAPAIREVLHLAGERLDGVAARHGQELYRDLPLQDSPDLSRRLEAILADPDFRRIVDTVPIN